MKYSIFVFLILLACKISAGETSESSQSVYSTSGPEAPIGKSPTALPAATSTNRVTESENGVTASTPAPTTVQEREPSLGELRDALGLRSTAEARCYQDVRLQQNMELCLQAAQRRDIQFAADAVATDQELQRSGLRGTGRPINGGENRVDALKAEILAQQLGTGMPPREPRQNGMDPMIMMQLVNALGGDDRSASPDGQEAPGGDSGAMPGTVAEE